MKLPTYFNALGVIEEMKQRILAHKKALVLQTIWEVSDYSDAPAIKHAKRSHNAAELRVVRKLREAGHDGLIVGASGCALCAPCAQTQGQPCKFPDPHIFLYVRLLHLRQKAGRCLRHGI